MLVRIDTHLSVLVQPVPSVGVADVWIRLEDLGVDNAFNGDLDVYFDERLRHRRRGQL